ncbi:Vps53p Ecym_8257 [Eremothecium cymbalariae DBVPG|uniref:Vps53 N-terminal domain-containing protein n=1 Tax=Eremothecium cymbalariae (strain CBS 270.75 / DBVPG 7215 / KCTC 17166 / NRRL Y-17582) TaxID=931890 RepID=G8JXG5_ERECY|nr:Hypothetical protein Ecym_8257 [Eremothecium cymbalariae DBVPG\
MNYDRYDYDPTEDIVNILSGTDSLDQLGELIAVTNKYKLQLEAEIREEVDGEIPGSDHENIEDLVDLTKDIQEVQLLSRTTECTISNLTKDISYLDNAKRNLTQSMTWFQNLKALGDMYAQCVKHIETNNFKEMGTPYYMMVSLSISFQEYRSVDEINKLLSQVAKLEEETVSRIKLLYRKLFENKGALEVDESEFRDGACTLLEVNGTAKFDVIDWCLDRILYEIREIFHVDDEAGSLENISRRYLFFKKLLNNFQVNFATYFSPDWDMPLRLVSTFIIFTKHDVEILLSREMKKEPSLELFVEALQSTIDFEKYINVKFSNKLNSISTEKISSCFGPFLSLWITHHDRVMNSKLLTYMSEQKLPNTSDSHVVPSSADLFRTYRSILTQTLELIDGDGRMTVLADLAKFFSKWLIEYSNKILQPLLLPENAKIEDKREVILYTILMINTADYCSITSGQLEEKLQEYAKSSDAISKNFEKSKANFGTLISRGIQFLIVHIVSPELRFAWREFSNYDWRHSMVEDYSRYIVTLKHILSAEENQERTLLQYMLSQFNRDVYVWNLSDKIVDQVTVEYLRCIVDLLKSQEPFGDINTKRHLSAKQVVHIAEQLLLDVQLLKEALKKLPDSLPNVSSGQNNRVFRHVDANIQQLTDFINVLAIQADSPAVYQECYDSIIKTRNHVVWALILMLKGTPWDLAMWKSYWIEFKKEEPQATEKDRDTGFFIFGRDEGIIRSFVLGLLRIPDPTWKTFISDQLRIVISRPASRTPTPPPTTNSAPAINKTINENFKSLVSSSRFFHRGG